MGYRLYHHLSTTSSAASTTTTVGASLFTELSGAEYYGDKFGGDVGYYRLTFTEGDYELRIGLFSCTVDETIFAIRLVAGTYEYAERESLCIKTFFPADNTADEGSLLMDHGTPIPLTDGQLSILSSAGGYLIRGEFYAGEQLIQCKYSGPIHIDDRSDRFLHRADRLSLRYMGGYPLHAPRHGLLHIVMEHSETPGEGLQLALTVPLPEEGSYPADNVTLPTGIFHVSTDWERTYRVLKSYANEFQTLEYTLVDGTIASGILIDDGTISITDDEGVYKISTELTGIRFTVTDGSIHLHQRSDIIRWEFEGVPPTHAIDMTAPASSLDSDLQLTGLSLFRADTDDSWPPRDKKGNVPGRFWRILLYEEGVTVLTAPDGTLSVSGEGDLIGIQLLADSAATLPLGSYPLYDRYEIPESAGYALPGTPEVNCGQASIFDTGAGCWYAHFAPDSTGTSAPTLRAGAVQGETILCETADGQLQIDLSLKDKYGHAVTGNFLYPLSPEEVFPPAGEAPEAP